MNYTLSPELLRELFHGHTVLSSSLNGCVNPFSGKLEVSDFAEDRPSMTMFLNNPLQSYGLICTEDRIEIVVDQTIVDRFSSKDKGHSYLVDMTGLRLKRGTDSRWRLEK